jgi:hypothetical protein
MGSRGKGKGKGGPSFGMMGKGMHFDTDSDTESAHDNQESTGPSFGMMGAVDSEDDGDSDEGRWV